MALYHSQVRRHIITELTASNVLLILYKRKQFAKNVEITLLLSCEPRVTVTKYFVYTLTCTLQLASRILIDHLCINPTDRIKTQVFDRL